MKYNKEIQLSHTTIVTLQDLEISNFVRIPAPYAEYFTTSKRHLRKVYIDTQECLLIPVAKVERIVYLNKELTYIAECGK